EVHQLEARHRAVEGDAFRQEADAEPGIRAATAGRIGAEQANGARGRPDEAEKELDQRRLAGAVMADERDHLTQLERQRNIADGSNSAVLLRRGAPLGNARHCWASAASLGGCISGALSMTPPG